MSRRVGLSQEHKKYLEVLPFPKDTTPSAALLYHQAISFFRVFKLAFGNGSKKIRAFNDESETYSEHIIGNNDNLSVALVNYHFSIEMMLKGLICLKKGSLDENLETHDLMILLQNAQPHYADLSKIEGNTNRKLLLQELSSSFNMIRYAGGTVALSLNKRKGWKMKLPLQELSEMLDDIFIILFDVFEEAKKHP